MPWLRFSAAALLIAIALSPPAQAQAPTGPRSGHWAFEGSPLAPDPNVTWGKLDNGVRYALLPHRGIPGSVSLRLIVLAGSMDEQPDELGIAHFIEHMAFRGTKHFKAEDMVSFFQKLGVEYGADVNAVTTYDNTSFMLDFRVNTPELLSEGLQLFRDIGDGLTFDPAAINWERRVILSEMRMRDSLDARSQQDSFPVVFRGLPFAEHLPIGTEQSILSFTHNQFVRFHDRLYRPDLMVLVATGDFDPGMMKQLVENAFGGMAPAKGPVPARNDGRLDARGLRAGVFRINGVGSAQALAASVVPPTNKPDTKEALVERQRRDFVMDLLADRLRTRVPGVADADADHLSLLGYDAGMASVDVPGQDWAHGILAVDEVIRNTAKNGFEPGEVETLRQRQLGLVQHLIEQIPTMDPHELGDSLSDSIVNHTVFVGLEREQTWMKEWLEKITPAEATQTFRALWNIDNMAFHVGGDVGNELAASDIVKKVQQYRRDGLAYLPPPPAKESLATLKDSGKPTKVEERRDVPELGAVLMRFGNNVRLNFISNRQEPGLAHVVVRVGTGLLEMPGKQPALKEFGLDTVLASGTGQHRAEELGRIIDERLLDFSFDLDDRDAFSFRGEMGSENLETFLEIVAEYLRQPQFSDYAHDSAREQAAMNRSATDTGFQQAMRDLTNHLFEGDPRFVWGTPVDYMSLSVTDVRKWIEPSLTRGYVEVTIVGDLTEANATDAVARTLGALSPRAAEKKAAPAPAKMTAPAGFTRIEFVGEHNLGMAIGNWPVSGILNLHDQATLELLAKVLELRIREEVRMNLGLSYSPAVSFQPYDGFDGLSVLQATADCAPEEAAHVAQVIADVGARLAAEGVKPDEFAGSEGILKSQYRRAFLTNDFLVSMLLRAQERPESLDEAVQLHSGLIDRITIDEVNAWAKRVLSADNSRTAALVPKALIGVFDSSQQ